MHDAVCIVRSHVDRAVDDEAGTVRVVLRLGKLVAVDIDFKKRGSRDLFEKQPVRIDQELVFGPRDAQREMRAEHIGPAEGRGDAECSRKLAARFPFRRADTARRTGRPYTRDG